MSGNNVNAMPPESVHCVVTSPPRGASTATMIGLEELSQNLAKVFREVTAGVARRRNCLELRRAYSWQRQGTCGASC